MNDYKYIDYHLDILALKDFANSQIELNKMTKADGEIIFNCLKSVVFHAELKPFLYAPVGESIDSYYQKYVRLESEPSYNAIPDFFSSNGDFYELDRHYYVHTNEISFDIFSTLFALKLLELESLQLSIHDFLDFQVYDNFFGNKQSLASLCYNLLEVAGNFQLLPATSGKLMDWLQTNDLIINDNTALSNDFSTVTDLSENNDEIKSLKEEEIEESIIKAEHKDFKIEGNFNDEEINKYFSFLYLERSCDKKPFLEEAAVKEIFKNGLIVPANSPSIKYKLNIDPRFPRKIIDYSIHQFFYKHSITKRDKSNFLKFFGSYIEDYKAALVSEKNLKELTSNITGEKSPKGKIIWNNYLPERHHS